MMTVRKMPKRQVARTSSRYDDDPSSRGIGRSSPGGGSGGSGKFNKDPSASSNQSEYKNPSTSHDPQQGSPGEPVIHF